jgi:hypothetical protein
VFELSRCDCGDHLDVDYRQISPGLQRIRAPYPVAAGVAAHETDASLAAGNADGRPANDVNRQLKSYRGGRIPNGIRCHPARRPEDARSAVRFMISIRNRSVLPVAAGAVAASLAWGLAHLAKAVADRPRPYEMTTDAVLRQQLAHGTSFPSSHTAVTLAVAIALMPFLARPFGAMGIGYAVLVGWSRVYPGCTVRWTSWPEQASAWPWGV